MTRDTRIACGQSELHSNKRDFPRHLQRKRHSCLAVKSPREQTVDTMMNKAQLRIALLAARMKIGAEEKLRFDAAIATRVLARLEDNPVTSLGVYWPMRGEPELRPLYEELAARGVALSLPMVVDKDAPLVFVPWMPGDELVKDAMGVSIPKSRVARARPDTLLIPCVGFNPARIRLGYGGGFYDRTLAARPGVRGIGVAYSSGLAGFDGDPHDVALDIVITEVDAN
jgi:5-formyltetrahydrofolate cyclo-ligase